MLQNMGGEDVSNGDYEEEACPKVLSRTAYVHGCTLPHTASAPPLQPWKGKAGQRLQPEDDDKAA